ncbi:MAG: hypothetical protein H5U37_03600 [Caldisericia bacterium]|nr:hypothetical protein [Caldisericia bacterium]
MKKIFFLIIIIALFYTLIFYLTKEIDKNYILGFGWKAFLKENSKVLIEQKIGEIKENEDIFIKSIKIYPKYNGVLSYDLIKDLLKIDLDRPFTDLIRIISKERGEVFLKIEYESKNFNLINYVFGLPIRIDEINILIPLSIIDLKVN